MLSFLSLLKNVSINIKHFSVNFNKVSVILQPSCFRFANDIGEYCLPKCYSMNTKLKIGLMTTLFILYQQLGSEKKSGVTTKYSFCNHYLPFDIWSLIWKKNPRIPFNIVEIQLNMEKIFKSGKCYFFSFPMQLIPIRKGVGPSFK